MRILFKLFSISYCAFFFTTEGLHIKYIVNVPYYVPPPKLSASMSAVKSAENLSGVTYSKEEKTEFKSRKFKYRIDASSNFRGWLHVSNYATVRPKDEYEEAAGEVYDFIDIFRETSFLEISGSSRVEFNNSMIMFLFLNRYESVSTALNEQLFSTAYHVRGVKNIFINIGLWQPWWVMGIGRNIRTARMENVKSYFLKLLKYDADQQASGNPSNIAMEFLQKNEIDNLRNKNRVPYRELREALRIDDRKRLAFEMLNPNGDCIVYECMHDSDTTSLRIPTRGATSTNPIGLYTYYGEVIRQYYQQNGSFPDLITTGYRANRANGMQLLLSKGVKKAKTVMGTIISEVNKDMLCRGAASKIDSRLAYIPEPNFIVRAELEDGVPFIMKYSFLENPQDWSPNCTSYSFEEYDPHESSVLLAHMYGNLKRKPIVIFDSRCPIEIRLPDRMFKPKRNSKADYFRAKSDVYPNNLSQHFLCLNDSAKIAYRQLGSMKSGRFKYANCIFTSVFCTLFDNDGSLPVRFKTDLADDKANKILAAANKISDIDELITHLREQLFARYSRSLYIDNLAQVLFSAASEVRRVTAGGVKLKELPAAISATGEPPIFNREFGTKRGVVDVVPKAENFPIKLEKQESQQKKI